MLGREVARCLLGGSADLPFELLRVDRARFDVRQRVLGQTDGGRPELSYGAAQAPGETVKT